MIPTLVSVNRIDPGLPTIFLCRQTLAKERLPEPVQAAYTRLSTLPGQNVITLSSADCDYWVVNQYDKPETAARKENLRQKGHTVYQLLTAAKVSTLQLASAEDNYDDTIAFLEGLILSSYSYTDYKTDKSGSFYLNEIKVEKLKDGPLQELSKVMACVWQARHWVNEPVISLNAEAFGEKLTAYGSSSGIAVDVWNKSRIASMRFGGLLSVAAGAQNPPVFVEMEYKHEKAINKGKPIILVGKGVVFDTGGLTLKDTPKSMDIMKCDMAGAATAACVLKALADNHVPVHAIALIPACENRPGEQAIVPGDVISIYGGKTVEVLNTDAEGRLILADALEYAKKFHPSLVIDIATLTGAAVGTLGSKGAVMMGNADETTKTLLTRTGLDLHERLAELPMWEEYDEELKSDIADLKNIGGGYAGAITAGMFLKHFTAYPWLHLDIAGTAWLFGAEGYRPAGGTGTAVRLLYTFIKNKVKHESGY